MNGPLADDRPRQRVRQAGDGTLDTGALARAIRRQARLVGLAALVGALVAVILIIGSVPRYSATETILLDEERNELLNQVSAMPNAQRSDAAVQSEIEILGSQVLAMDVVERLSLHEDPSFMDPPDDLAGSLARGISVVTGWPSAGSVPSVRGSERRSIASCRVMRSMFIVLKSDDIFGFSRPSGGSSMVPHCT